MIKACREGGAEREGGEFGITVLTGARASPASLEAVEGPVKAGC